MAIFQVLNTLIDIGMDKYACFMQIYVYYYCKAQCACIWCQSKSNTAQYNYSQDFTQVGLQLNIRKVLNVHYVCFYSIFSDINIFNEMY